MTSCGAEVFASLGEVCRLLLLMAGDGDNFPFQCSSMPQAREMGPSPTTGGARPPTDGLPRGARPKPGLTAIAWLPGPPAPRLHTTFPPVPAGPVTDLPALCLALWTLVSDHKATSRPSAETWIRCSSEGPGGVRWPQSPWRQMTLGLGSVPLIHGGLVFGSSSPGGVSLPCPSFTGSSRGLMAANVLAQRPRVPFSLCLSL